jgi:iron complex outermembrane recepter protein
MKPEFLMMNAIHGILRTCGMAVLAAGALALALPAAAHAQAQTHEVTGRVLASESREPLAGVQVSAAGRVAYTDAQGRFRLTAVPAGEHVLRLRMLGRVESERALTVPVAPAAPLELLLEPLALHAGELVVTASREATRRLETPASIGVVSGAALREARPSHPSEVLNRVAGVWINVTGGEGHMTAIRQPKTTSPLYLFLEDGVPTRSTGFFNHNALYEVNVPQAERLEVMKGPGSALYGSDAIGGTVNVLTRSAFDGPAASASVEHGAFGFSRALLSGALRGGADALRGDVNVTRTDGWREGTAYERQSATLRWDRRLGAGSSLRAVATYSRVEQSTAGSSAISREDYETRPTVNYTPISYRSVDAARLTTTWERLSGAWLLSATGFARWNRMELLPNWSLAFDPYISESGHASAGALLRVRRELASLRGRVLAGVDADWSPGSQREWSLSTTREGRVYTAYETLAPIYDYDVTFRSLSPYVQLEAAPLPRVRVVAGARYDRIGYNYVTKLEPTQTGAHRRPENAAPAYTHLSPKLGVTWELMPELNAYASWSRGFRAPSQSQLFRQGRAANTVALQPVRADNVEAGVRGSLAQRVSWELVGYRMTKRDDILSYRHADGSTETVNAGRTLHRGVELTVGAELGGGLRADVAFARNRHDYDVWQPQPDVDLGGMEVEDAPRETASLALRYAPAALRGAALTAEWMRIGPYWMDAQNTHRYDGHDLLHVRLNAPLRTGAVLFARLMNATDARFAEGAAYTPARGEEFAPGLPRTLYVGVQLQAGR